MHPDDDDVIPLKLSGHQGSESRRGLVKCVIEENISHNEYTEVEQIYDDLRRCCTSYGLVTACSRNSDIKKGKFT